MMFPKAHVIQLGKSIEGADVQPKDNDSVVLMSIHAVKHKKNNLSIKSIASKYAGK